MKDILIIGESCRDVYVYCDAVRLAPDVPVPVLNIIDSSENVGMAKNVQRNILSISDKCDIITNANWQHITKTRYVHEKTNHMFFRVDSAHDIKKINLEDINFDYKVIVISDYDKGFLSESDIEYICSNHSCVFLDTKKTLGSWAENAKFIKINDYEFNRSIDSINANANLSKKIIHTLGGDGCEYLGKQYRVQESEVKDVSGAGDSFLAALVVKYLRTTNIDESIKYANKCASEVVTHKGVSVISKL